MVQRIRTVAAIAALTLAVGSAAARSSGPIRLVHPHHRSTRSTQQQILRHDHDALPPRGGGLGSGPGQQGLGGGGSIGLNRGARRAPTTLPPAQDSYQSQQQQQQQQQSAPPPQQQMEQLDAKEAMNSFLTRDSRNTFIGTLL